MSRAHFESIGLWRAFHAYAMLVTILALASPAWAGWREDKVLSSEHPTWIYQPSAQGGTVENGKWALMIVLHGCAQTAEQLKNHGSLQDAAERRGFVLALPNVGKNAMGQSDDWAFGCWDYDEARNRHGHIQEIKELAVTLIARYNGKIHPAHVYVVGLSSGGALSQALGCAAPDVFAGVGALAGPSVGSWQLSASADKSALGPWNVDRAVRMCRKLAGSNASRFKTQIANIGAGTMDRNGTHERHLPCSPSKKQRAPAACGFPGQYKMVSVMWSDINAEMYRRIYETGPLTDFSPRTPGLAFEKIASTLEQTQTGLAVRRVRLGRISISEVGHAWPAGAGIPGNGGDWIATRGLSYPKYIMDWFIQNNQRAAADAANARQ